MGEEKHRNIGLAILASIAVTEIPWQLRRSSCSGSEMQAEKELWFLTQEQFHTLSSTVDVTGISQTHVLDLEHKGGEVEADLDGGTFMVLELAKRWNKLQPTLACIKGPLNYQAIRGNHSWIASIADTTEVRAGRANIDSVSQIVAEHLSARDVDQLLSKNGRVVRCIVFNPLSGAQEGGDLSTGTEAAGSIQATNFESDPNDEHDQELLLQRINLLERTDAEINQGSDLFVKTSSFEEALHTVAKYSCVVVTGESGDGKTTTAMALCRHFRDSGNYTPVIIKHPDEWKKFVHSSEKQIVLIEDMFGKINLSLANVVLWKEVMPVLVESFSGGMTNILLVITNKPGFVNKALPLLREIPCFASQCIINISVSLSCENKMSLVRIYGRSIVNSSDSRWAENFKEDIGFPLTCKLILQRGASEKAIFDGFRIPVTFLREDLKTLMQSNSSCHAFLLLLVCSGGNIDITDRLVTENLSYLQKKLPKESKQPSINEIAKSVPPCYVQAHPLMRNIISFTHQSVFFIVADHMASKDMDLVLETANVSVLQELFVLETGDFQKMDRYIIVPLSKQKILAERFFRALNDGQISVFLNGSFGVRSFLQHFFNLLAQRGSIKEILAKGISMGMSPLHYIAFNNIAHLSNEVMNFVEISLLTRNEIFKVLLTCCRSGNKVAMAKLLSKCQHFNFKSKELTEVFLTSLLWSQNHIFEYILEKTSENDIANVLYHLFFKTDFQNAAVILSMITSQDLKHRLTSNRYTCSLHDSECTPVTCLSERKNLDMLRQYCEFGANVDANNSKGNSPLTISIQNNNMNLVTTLLSNRAKVNAAVGSNLETPLHVACLHQNICVAELLISYGANVDARTANMKTPLDYACHKDTVSIVRTLLLQIGKLHKDQYDCMQPIHVASAVGNSTAIKLLLENRDQVNRMSTTRKTPLHYACTNGDGASVRLLIKSLADINCTDKDGKTPLHMACQKAHFDAVDALLQGGAHINCVDRSQMTPLLVACDGGDLKIIKLLIDNGANVNKDNLVGKSPLHVAAYKGHHAVVKLLLHAKANVRKETVDKVTPLHVACQTSDYLTVKVLLDSGADVSASTVEGKTPLHYACLTGNSQVVKTLLRRGAKANTETIDKTTPFHLACKSGDSETILFLQNHVHKINKPLHFIRKRGEDLPLKNFGSLVSGPKGSRSSSE